jgi:VWFA-related protein
MGATMKRLWHVAVVLIIGTHAVRAHQTPSQNVFRTAVDVVRLDVLATAAGRPIGGLGPQDFEVLDNRVPQRVTVATIGGALAVALVLDTSGSVSGRPFDQLVAASELVIRNLEPEDRVSLVTLAHGISLEANAVRDPAGVKATLLKTRTGGRTALWDALFTGLSLVAGVSERSIVLLFTDGVDNSSWLTRDQVAESLKYTETVVYAIKSPHEMGVRSTEGSTSHLTSDGLLAAQREREQKAGSDLVVVAKQSGGNVLEASTATSLPTQFASILQEFRSRYLISYEPTGVRRDDGWHRVEVRVKGRSAKVVTRAGYYATRAPGG